jgi:hypothetical protein
VEKLQLWPTFPDKRLIKTYDALLESCRSMAPLQLCSLEIFDLVVTFGSYAISKQGKWNRAGSQCHCVPRVVRAFLRCTSASVSSSTSTLLRVYRSVLLPPARGIKSSSSRQLISSRSRNVARHLVSDGNVASHLVRDGGGFKSKSNRITAWPLLLLSHHHHVLNNSTLRSYATRHQKLPGSYNVLV